MALPSGTVTLLFTDIEGSTRLLEMLGERYLTVLDRHRRIVRDAVAAHGGWEVRTEGDAFFVAFARAGDAVRAAVAAQRALVEQEWPPGVAMRVRMGVHTGEPRLVGRDYEGIDVHCAARICAAAHGGQVVVSGTTARILATEPDDGVGLRDLGEHRLKDLSRPLRLHQVVADGLLTDFPALRSQPRTAAYRPTEWAPPTALFGRETDVRGLAGVLREPANRLVTLVGPGGVGKTRLAIETAARVATERADGACFVALASLFEPRELASAIARAVAAPIRDEEPAAAALVRFLSDRDLLLVLDNFEHLVAGAPVVGELVRSCPRLTVLVTSRRPTRLAGERLHPVRPLQVPDAQHRASPLDLERYAAVAMFCDRARARDPRFAVDESNASDVEDICRRLDGLPLALELAAGRCGLLTASELAVRLDRALPVLVGGACDAPDRHRTLRATIDWSYDLLSSEERRTLTQLAVFVAGATVDAAESVTGASLDTLDSLVGQQLLTRRGERLLMPDSVREYALERLGADPDRDNVNERLAQWCLRSLPEATPHLVRASRTAWLARIDAEVPNAIAALSWALDQRRAQLALQLVCALGEYWWGTNNREEGLAWIDAALGLARTNAVQLRGTALLYRARLIDARQQARFRADLQASLELLRGSGDLGQASACLGYLAIAESWVGRDEEARALSDESVRLAERSRDELASARALVKRAQIAATYDDAARRARAALPRVRRVGDLVEYARLCCLTGYKAIPERRYRSALTWLDEGLEAARGLDDIQSLFYIRGCQGLAHLFLGELDDAAQSFRDALGVCRDAGAQDTVDEALLGLAAVEALHGNLGRAARLSGAAHGNQIVNRSAEEHAIWSQLNSEIINPAREKYGTVRWELAEREGAALTAIEAIDLACTPVRRGRADATPRAAAPG